jgi:hypothetical protein
MHRQGLYAHTQFRGGSCSTGSSAARSTPLFIITRRALDEAPEFYQTFRDNEYDCVTWS